MIALAPPPALVSPAPASAPAFHPPLGRPVAYTMTDEQRGSRGPQRFEAHVTLEFETAPDGFLMTLTTQPGASGGNAVFEGAMDAFAAIPLRYRLGSGGELLDVLDADASWTAAAAAISQTVAAATRRHPATPMAKALQGFRDAFAATPPDARRATLLANAQAIVGLPDSDLAVGATRPWSGAATDVGGRPVALAGTLTRLPDAEGAVRLRITGRGGSAGAGAPDVEEVTEIAIAAADGLLVSSRRTLRMAAAAEPFFVETIARDALVP